jgi:hypothetical protein
LTGQEQNQTSTSDAGVNTNNVREGVGAREGKEKFGSRWTN